MKVLFKVTAVILLLAITFISINAAAGITVTIEGKGQPFVKKEGGSVEGGCDPVNNNDCKITIEVPIQ